MTGDPGTDPPETFGVELLEWVRATTERRWAETEDLDLSNDRVFWPRWLRGTRWTGGLDDAVVTAVEHEHGVRFTPQHRLFLTHLHSTTPWQHGPDRRRSRENPETVRYPGFYDWQHEGSEIRAASREAVDGVVRDVLTDDFWGGTWGPRPSTESGRRDGLAELLADAPRLLPIFGHRFVVDHADAPVLSIAGIDVVLYGTDLRDYLLRELDLEATPRRRGASAEPHIPFWGDLLHALN